MNVFCANCVPGTLEPNRGLNRKTGFEVKGSEGQRRRFGLVAFRNIPSLYPCNYARLYPVARWNNSSPRTEKKTDAETLAEIRKALERPGDEFARNRPEDNRG